MSSVKVIGLGVTGSALASIHPDFFSGYPGCYP